MAEPAPAQPTSLFGHLHALRRRLIIRLGLTLLEGVDRILVRYSRLGDPAVFDTTDFPWATELEHNWPLIRREADEILRDAQNVPPLRHISPDNEKISPDDKWRSFFFLGYGIRVDANCERCPQTSALIERIPELQTALFSILSPGTRIPPHTGATKAILTGHLGLRVPREWERCRIIVDGQPYAWREGKLFIFDDMHTHEVSNDTDEYRVTLMLHVTRPQRFPGTRLASSVLAIVRRSPYVADVRKRLDEWADRSLVNPA